MKNKKGFTLIELLGVIVIIAILLTMATFTYSGYLKKSKDKVFDLGINSFEDAAASALDDCETSIGTGANNSFCNQHGGIPDIGEEEEITLEELVRYQYIEKIKSPYKSGDVCTGTTTVKRVGVEKIKHTIKNSDGTTRIEEWDGDDSNVCLEYETCLTCSGKTKCKNPEKRCNED